MSGPAHWIAVAASRAVKRPCRVVVDGVPLVLFRENGVLRCLLDRCPHRGAPLSRGQVVGGLIECPYHGWRFDGAGRCRAMPGLSDEAMPRVAVPSRAVHEEGGLVFLADGVPAQPPYVCAVPPGDRVTAIAESRVNARLIDVAENILDATHTHFTHKGLLRGLSGARRPIQVMLSAGAGWVEARYEGEPRQDGLISRLLEGGRSVSIGRFLHPGIAELEFLGPNGINLATTFHLREEMPGVTTGLAILAGPRQRGLGLLKAAAFMPLFKIALSQDRRILEACTRNRAAHAAGFDSALVSPLDVLRPHIEAVLAGRAPVLATTELVIDL